MYFLLHPISALNHFISRIFTDQLSLLFSLIFFFYLGKNFKNSYWENIDQKIVHWADNLKNVPLKKTASDFAIFGNAIFHISFSIIFALTILFFKQSITTSLSILFCLVFSWGLNRLLKILYKRERPEVQAQDVIKRKSYCFPSGHVMASISIYFFSSILLQNILPFIPWFIVSLAICSFVTLSRIFLNHHFFTDILGGICMGIVALNISIWVYFLFGVVF